MMNSRSRLARFGIPIGVVALLCLGSFTGAQTSRTITATAGLTSRGGVAATAPVSIIIDRLSTDAERDEVLAALKKGGTDAVRGLLSTRSPIGWVKVAATNTAAKYIYERTTAGKRVITVVTGVPIAYVGASAIGPKTRVGFELGLVTLEMSGSGPGQGELVPAAKVRLNEQGALVTESYSPEVVKLTNVVGK